MGDQRHVTIPTCVIATTDLCLHHQLQSSRSPDCTPFILPSNPYSFILLSNFTMAQSKWVPLEASPEVFTDVSKLLHSHQFQPLHYGLAMSRALRLARCHLSITLTKLTYSGRAQSDSPPPPSLSRIFSRSTRSSSPSCLNRSRRYSSSSLPGGSYRRRVLPRTRFPRTASTATFGGSSRL